MKKLSTIYTLLILFSPVLLSAQDNYYWTQQFGAHASLLGGSVIAGINDNSAAFYNPGRLSFINDPGISVNANVYNIDFLNIKNGAGEGIDLESNVISFFPQLISGNIHMKNSKIKMGYVLLTKQNREIKYNQRHEMFYDVIPNEPGDEEFIGTYELETSKSELWPGICFSYLFSKKIGIGISQFLNYHHQSHRHSVFIRAIPTQLNPLTEEFYVATYNLYENFTVDNISTLWKLGLAIKLSEKLKIGLAYNSPSINLFGLGSVQREISLLNLSEVISDTVNLHYYTDLLAMDRQTNLSTVYRTPQSVSAGLDYTFRKKTSISVSTEYFFKLPVYTVIDPKPSAYIRPSSVWTSIENNPALLRYQNYSERILNYAIGIETEINDKLSLLTGFRTDRNSYFSKTIKYKKLQGLLTYPTLMNLYHVSAGITVSKEKSKLTFGVNYAFGRKADMIQFINFKESKDVNYMNGPVTSSASGKFNSFSVIIGYFYSIKQK